MVETPVLAMTNDIGSLSSSFPAWLQAIAAFLGLLFVGWQIRLARKSSDLQTLMQFVENFRQHEHRLLSSKSSEERKVAFVDLLNLLETWAAAYNGKLLRGESRKMAELKLRDALALIQADKNLGEEFVDSMSSEDTFSGIHKFYTKNSKSIDEMSRGLRKQSEPRSI